MKRDAAIRQILREDMFRKAWLPLIEVDRDQIKMNRRSALQDEQDIQ